MKLADGQDRDCRQDQLHHRTVTYEDSEEAASLSPADSSVFVPEIMMSDSPLTRVQSSLDNPATESSPNMPSILYPLTILLSVTSLLAGLVPRLLLIFKCVEVEEGKSK